MSDVKALLEQATPLPWRLDEFDLYLVGPDDENIHWDHEGLGATWRADADPKLIVHAVNSLPDYEAAVDALAYYVEKRDQGHDCANDAPAWRHRCRVAKARAALARLRGDR